MENGKLRKTILLAITLAVIANFVFSSAVFAKRFTISDEDMKRIKESLSWAKMFLNITISDDKLKSILNTTIKTGEISGDITYGLLVLTALNEIDFIDMVVSQRYKTMASEYFFGLLDEKLNLGKYWQGIGYDIPKLLSGVVTGPIAALTLNTFDISDKTIEVLVALKVLKDLKMYDGLWHYFDTREGGESHKTAWEEAEIIIGWAAADISVLLNPQKIDQRLFQLESQLFELYKKWGPYVTINVGVNKEYKEQAQKELRDTLVLVIETQKFVQEELKLSLAEKLKSAWNNLVKEIEKISSKIQTLVRLGGAQVTPLLEEVKKLEELPAELTEVEPLSSEEPSSSEPQLVREKPKMTLDEIQEVYDDISEKIDALSKNISDEVNKQKPEELNEAKPLSLEEENIEEITELDEELVEEIEDEEVIEVEPLSGRPLSEEVVWCEKTGGAVGNKIIFNEIAWMGTENSSDDEWFKIKNISGENINLASWQILDKEKQIKIVFNEGDRISINGVLLLERTDDDSVAGVTADLIYTGALNNTNEALYLFNNNCQLQDEVLANPDWPAGDNNSKKIMERKSDLTWQTKGYIPPYYSGGAPPPAPVPIQETPVSYLKILINEIQIESQTSEKDDFVELYNPNIEDIDLTNWYIQRKTKNAADFSSFVSKNLFLGKTVAAQDYFLIANASSGFSAQATTTYPLTEDNTLVLKNPNGDIVDLVGWGEAQDFETATTTNPPAGKSIGRKWSTTTLSYIDTDNNYEDFKIQISTPGIQNQGPQPEPEPEPEPQSEEPVLSVVINEIAWMGTSATNSSDEWIELYNNSTSTIDITGWQLVASDTSPSITFSTSSIFANSFYLIERSDDDVAVSDILADWKGSFGAGLKNTGERLELRDASNTLIDIVDCSSGWFAGTTTPAYISMERISATSSATSTNWASNNLIIRNGKDAAGNNINGTPKAQNSVSFASTTVSSLPFDEFSEITLTYLGNPYFIKNSLTVPIEKILRIEPGVIIKFNKFDFWTPEDNLIIEGTLIAEGKSGKEIIFTSFSEEKNDNDWWSRIYFAPSSQNSILDHCRLEYGGNRNMSAFAIAVDSSSIEFKNSILENFSQSGLGLFDSSSTIENLIIQNSTCGESIKIVGGAPSIKNSIFRNTWSGMIIEGESSALVEGNTFSEIDYPAGPIMVSNSCPVFINNNALNNTINGIYFRGTLNQNCSLKKDLPYLVDNLKVPENIVLTIEAETIVKFFKNGRLEVYGTLDSQGNSIIFTSIFDDETGGDTNNDTASTEPFSSGFWDQIFFATSSQNSILKNNLIKYGGTGGKGAVYIKESAVKLKNNYFKDDGPGFYSLYIENSTSTIIEDSIFENCNIGIKVIGGCPQTNNLNFTNCAHTFCRVFEETETCSTSTLSCF